MHVLGDAAEVDEPLGERARARARTGSSASVPGRMKQVLVGLLGGPGAARVDDDEPAAALADRRAAGPRMSGAVIRLPLDTSGFAPSISR